VSVLQRFAAGLLTLGVAGPYGSYFFFYEERGGVIAILVVAALMLGIEAIHEFLKLIRKVAALTKPSPDLIRREIATSHKLSHRS
jgi:hypothetical protein